MFNFFNFKIHYSSSSFYNAVYVTKNIEKTVHDFLKYRVHQLPSRGFQKNAIDMRYVNGLKYITFKDYPKSD